MQKPIKASFLAVMILTTSVVASDILATVNGKNITKQDAQAFVTASAPQTNFAALSPTDQKLVVNRLIEKSLFIELAAKEGIDKKPEFQRNMEKIKEELLVNMWMKTQMENALVSASETKEFYEKNKDKFMEKASMHARHILVETEKSAKEIIDSVKSLKGDELKNKFMELAKTKSTGPSGPQGGDLGTFSKGQMVPEFSKAAWELNNGEVTTTPVKTQFGYHVIFLENKEESKPSAYEQVKEKIIATLKQQQFAAKITEVAKELKSKAKIVDMTVKENSQK